MLPERLNGARSAPGGDGVAGQVFEQRADVARAAGEGREAAERRACDRCVRVSMEGCDVHDAHREVEEQALAISPLPGSVDSTDPGAAAGARV